MMTGVHDTKFPFSCNENIFLNLQALAQDKANAMIKKIGYPDWMSDSENLDKYYEKVSIRY